MTAVFPAAPTRDSQIFEGGGAALSGLRRRWAGADGDLGVVHRAADRVLARPLVGHLDVHRGVAARSAAHRQISLEGDDPLAADDVGDLVRERELAVEDQLRGPLVGGEGHHHVEGVGGPAHAAAAHIGVNAILKMRIIIDALENLNNKRQNEIHYEYAEVSNVMKGKATTINIGVIKSGDWPSTVPAHCILECRIGFPPGELKKDVMVQVEQTISYAASQDPWLKEHPPKIEWFGWSARPYEQDPNHPFVKLLQEKVEEFVGINPILYGGTAGMDTRFFGHHGIPVVAYGPYGERGHSVDERVSINSVIKVTEVIIGTILKWCG